MQTDPEPPQARTLATAYAGLVLIWSTTPLSVVLSLRDLDAIWALSLRMAVAAVLASLVLYGAGLRLQRDASALRLYATGALSTFGAMFFTYLGARHLPSGLISVLFGLSPLMVGVLSRLLLPGVRLAPLQWGGMVLGLLGLAVIFLEGDKRIAIDTGSVLLVLTGVLSYAVSAVLMRRSPRQLHPLEQTTGALWVSLLCCGVALPAFGGPLPAHMPGRVTTAALLYSASFGSIIAMLCYFFLLRHVAPGTVALSTLLTPVFALLLGMAVNHEHFRAQTLWGMVLILAGLLGYYEREIRRSVLRAAIA